ncbi:MAG: hypothetical protein J6C31_00045 [Prevotella sp.]|nr:hypothetical protein [Prevotella sp.]
MACHRYHLRAESPMSAWLLLKYTSEYPDCLRAESPMRIQPMATPWEWKHR